MNLHHVLQTQDGPLAEMTQTFHQQNYKTIHINPNTILSGIDRLTFNTFRQFYWIKSCGRLWRGNALSIHEFEESLQLIHANAAVADCAGPKPKHRIRRAEEALGVEFPQTYRTFMNRLGAGSVGAAEFYGVISEDFEHSSVPDAIWLTHKQRKSSNAPGGLTFVSESGDGGYYAIDLDQTNSDSENPIVEWWPGASDASGNRRFVAADFDSFLLERVQERLDQKKSVGCCSAGTV